MIREQRGKLFLYWAILMTVYTLVQYFCMAILNRNEYFNEAIVSIIYCITQGLYLVGYLILYRKQKDKIFNIWLLVLLLLMMVELFDINYRTIASEVYPRLPFGRLLYMLMFFIAYQCQKKKLFLYAFILSFSSYIGYALTYFVHAYPINEFLKILATLNQIMNIASFWMFYFFYAIIPGNIKIDKEP